MIDDNSLLVSMDSYLKSGIHIGTKFKTKYMANFIYKTKPDGLVVMNLQKIDERLRIAANFLANYAPEEIGIVSKRENGWKPLRAFNKATGVRIFTARYPPGLLTNQGLRDFVELKVMVVTDAWPDKNAVDDALRMGIPIVALCDTNNQSNKIDLVVPCNNKGKKALGLCYWILATEYLRNRGLLERDKELAIPLEDFTEE